jgi:hypothetical protein
MLDFVLHPAWRSLYADWKSSQERWAIIQIVRRLGIRGGDLRPVAVGRLLEARIAPQFAGSDFRALQRYAAAVLRSRISQSLAPLHVHKALSAWKGLGVDLVADLTAILSWRFYADCMGSHSPKPVGEWKSPATAWLEANASRDEQSVTRLLDRFRCWLNTVS